MSGFSQLITTILGMFRVRLYFSPFSFTPLDVLIALGVGGIVISGIKKLFD